MREIAQRQEENIAQKQEEKKRFDDELLKLRGEMVAVGTSHSAASDGRADLNVQIAAERAKVERLRREVHVWRCERGSLLGDRAADGKASQPMVDESRHQADRKRWEAERRALHNELEDVTAKCRRVAQESATQRETALAAGMSAARSTDLSALQDEVARDRQAAAFAWQRCAEMSRQIEEERAEHLALTSHSKRESEERSHLERRLEVEKELHAAQQIQLKSVEDIGIAADLQRARRENTELRASLLQNQAALRQLRH